MSEAGGFFRAGLFHCEGGVEVGEEGVLQVLVGEKGLRRVDLPVDAEGCVADGDAAVGLRSIVVVTLVLEHSHFAEHRESMRETARDEELPMVLLTEFHSHMLAVCRRALADVDCHVEHTSLDAAH